MIAIAIEARQTFATETTEFVNASRVFTASAVTTVAFVDIDAICDATFIGVTRVGKAVLANALKKLSFIYKKRKKIHKNELTS